MIYPWQQFQWSKLVKALASRRLPHAIMLSGPQGSGKKSLADYFANLVLCDESVHATIEQPIEAPCGQCKSCKLVLSEGHPDIRVYAPEEKSTVIKVDQIRELNDFIAKSSQQGGYKVAVVYPAEAMNVNAANALLKSLEEPSRNTLIILVVDQPGRMLPTIRSRCQVLECPMPGWDNAIQWLEVNLTEKSTAADLLEMAAGSPINALAMAGGDVVEQKQLMIADLAAVLKRETTVVAVAVKWQKHELQSVLNWNLVWVQQLIRFSMTKEDNSIRDERLVKMFQYLSSKHSSSRFYELLDCIKQSSDNVARNTNPNHQILIENVLVGWSELMQKTPT